MGAVSESASIVSTDNNGHSCPGADKIVRRKFGAVCKVLWPAPEKPDVELAFLGEVDTRTARRWMRGEADPPWPVVRAVLDKMFEPISD